MSAPVSVLALVAVLTLAIFLGITNFSLWSIQRKDRSHLWLAAWLAASAVFSLCRLLQYAGLSEQLYIIVPRILLSAGYALAFVGYELANAFVDYRPPLRERSLIILLTATPIALLWASSLILTDQIVVRTIMFGEEFRGVEAGPLYLPAGLLILALGVVPPLRLLRMQSPHRGENLMMAAGLLFVILFSINDIFATAFSVAWIRLSDYSYLPVAIFFSYIQVARFGRLYKNMDVLIDERTTELRQANEGLRKEIAGRNRVEEALRESEERYRLLIDSAREVIFSVAPDGTFTSLNPSFEYFTGWRRDEWLGRSLAELIAEEDRQSALGLFERVFRGETVRSIRLNVPTRSGDALVVELNISPQNKDGQVVGLLGIARDITLEQHALDALRDSEKRYHALFEQSHDAIFVLDLHGRHLDANQRAADMLGYTLDELIGLSYRDLSAEPEPSGKVMEHLLRGELVPLYERVFRKKNGDLIHVELNVELVRDIHGNPLHIQSMARDITERKRAEEEIRRRAEETAALLNTSLALSSLDLDTILQTVSSHAVRLFSADGCRIFLMEPDGRSLHCVLALREDPAAFSNLRVRIGEGVTGAVAASGKAEIVNDMLHDPRAVDVPGTAAEQECIMFAPLKEQERTIGVLSVRRVDIARPFYPDDLELLEAFASLTASAVSNARLLQETQRRLERLSILRHVDQVISGGLDLRVTLDILLGYILQQLEIDAAVVLLYRPDLQHLEFAAGRGFRTQALQYTTLRLGEGFAGRAALEQRIVQISDLNQMHTGFLRSPKFREERFVAYIGIPLIAKGDMIGVLEIYHRRPISPDHEWMAFLETLAGQAAIAIDNIRLFEGLQTSNLQLRQAYDATIEGWARALELRDMETEGHSRRVVDLTLELAREMGAEESQLAHIRRGALLHDIGKMGVPDVILQKRGPLNEDEWKIMRQHPVNAYRWLNPIAYLQPALDIPYCHHEKWDGSGYPRGLRGEQIPLAARIFAIVDVWDALRSDRPYRSSWSAEKTRAYLMEQSGKHFDPQVVEAFLPLIEND